MQELRDNTNTEQMEVSFVVVFPAICDGVVEIDFPSSMARFPV